MRKCGIMLSEFAFNNFPVLLKQSSMDFMIVDCEHGAFDYSAIAGIVTTSRLCRLKCIIRLPDNQRKDIIRFLDMGADGLLLPMTSDVEDIKKVVQYAKYPPIGKRGVSTMRAHTFYSPPPINEYMQSANERIEIYAQIETTAGSKNFEQIISSPGVTGFFFGPNDFSADLQGSEEKKSDKILHTIADLSKIAEQQGKSSGIITSNEKYLCKAKREGMLYFCVGSELSILKKGAISTVKTILD